MKIFNTMTHKIFLAMVILFEMNAAYAYKQPSPNAKCHLNPEQRKNPDFVMRDFLELGNISCGNMPSIEDKNHYKKMQNLPLNGFEKILMKHGGNYEAIHSYYKDFKILERAPGDLIDGRPTMVYKVELIYALVVANYIDTSPRKLESGVEFDDTIVYISKEMPVCEKVIVNIIVGDTPWGWYKLPNPNIGTHLSAYLKRAESLKFTDNYKNRPKLKAQLKAETARYARLAGHCKSKL